jgi:hypothetical protein
MESEGMQPGNIEAHEAGEMAELSLDELSRIEELQAKRADGEITDDEELELQGLELRLKE